MTPIDIINAFTKDQNKVSFILSIFSSNLTLISIEKIIKETANVKIMSNPIFFIEDFIF